MPGQMLVAGHGLDGRVSTADHLQGFRQSISLSADDRSQHRTIKHWQPVRADRADLSGIPSRPSTCGAATRIVIAAAHASQQEERQNQTVSG
jgi:hypothetical protein